MKWEVIDMKEGNIIEDWLEDGVRVIVMRGPASLCAYIGVPSNHPLAGFDYDDIPLDCHGGFTFAREGDEEYHPKGYYWYGWDYAHSGDACVYSFNTPGLTPNQDDKQWTVQEVVSEAKDVAWNFARLVKLAENLTNKATNVKT